MVVFYITDNGLIVAQRLKGLYPHAQILKFKREILSNLWNKCKNLIFIMATGIVTRTIAPLIKNKKIDPAVVVLDENGRFAISLLSGHIGGANNIANEIAEFLGGEAVITTASNCLKNLVVGIGCNSKTSEDEIEDAIKRTLKENNLSFSTIHSISTLDKKGNESGLITFAKKYGFKINTFTPDELNTVSGISKSEAACKATGANAVAEPSAWLASGAKRLLVPKQKIGNVTVAVTKQKAEVRMQKAEKRGKIYIVGTGPGEIEHITPKALEVIREAEVIVGYKTYLDLIQELIKNKEIISTGMTEEIDRCKKAIELAFSGKTVAVISGGDPGIYAMAGLIFELLKERQTVVDNLPFIKVVPGISALNACAARLGAPLMHDFASISLLDRLTPWEFIEKKIESAVIADFVIVLYNPGSKGRPKHINRTREIILKYRKPETPVGIVKSAMRKNEKVIITNLKDMLDNNIDMQSTVIIGNSQTFIWNGVMITRRGYPYNSICLF